ncbi:MAG TPA: TolC family protein [Bryobacteraceae bacterium]|nr:TolC family protein [Bryobacteraceae bacterium]
MHRFIFLFAPLVLFAQEPVRLDALVEEALSNHPEITAAQKAFEASRQRPSQQGALPDPMVSLSYNSMGNPLPGAGLGREPNANIGAALSQEFLYPGKRGLKRDMAAREADAARREYDIARLAVASRVKQAYHRLAQAYATAAVLEENRDLLDRFLRISEARYSAGQTAQQDIFRTQTQLSILETRLERLKQEMRAREAELGALLGREFKSQVAEVAAAPLNAPVTAIIERAAETAPILGREQKLVERAEIATRLARKELYPDFTVSGGVYAMGSMGQMYMARLDFTLPLWAARKQRAGIAEQVAATRQSKANYEAAGRTIEARVREDYSMAETAWKLMEIYRNTVIPQSQLALESSLASYQTGAVDLLTVLSNFSTTLEYQTNVIDERANYLLAVARIEEITGIEVTR